MATTKRADFRAGVLTVLNDYKTDNTDSTVSKYLAHVYDHPTPRITGRSAYLEKQIDEQISFGGSLRTRILTGRVVVTTKLASNDQAADEQDALVDALIEQFTEFRSTAVTKCLLLPAGVEDIEVQSDDGTYTAFRLSLQLFVQEGMTI